MHHHLFQPHVDEVEANSPRRENADWARPKAERVKIPKMNSGAVSVRLAATALLITIGSTGGMGLFSVRAWALQRVRTPPNPSPATPVAGGRRTQPVARVMNRDRMAYCDEMPGSIRANGADIRSLGCTKVDHKTTELVDVGSAPFLVLREVYGLLFWASLIPAVVALCCYTDKKGIAGMGRAGSRWIALLSQAGGWRSACAHGLTLLTLISPLVFAVQWSTTQNGRLAILVDNSRASVATVRVGRLPSFDMVPMSHVFVYVTNPDSSVSVRAIYSDGFEEVKSFPQADGVQTYAIGGFNNYDSREITYTQR
jgi:hypothetical protein